MWRRWHFSILILAVALVLLSLALLIPTMGGQAIGLRLVPMVRDLRFAWEVMAQQRLDEQAQKVCDSLHAALIGWALSRLGHFALGVGGGPIDNGLALLLRINAALLATSILGAQYPEYRRAYERFREQQTAAVLAHRNPGLAGS